MKNTIMNKRESYSSPMIIREVKLELSACLLDGSVVTPNTTIRTAGQDVENHDFSTGGFNDTWQ